MRGRRGLALAVVASLVAPAACSSDGPGEGEARLELEGEALVERSDGDREVVTSAEDLDTGDRITLTSGQGTLFMAGGVQLELREGRDADRASSTVVVRSIPVLEAGELLVTAPSSAEVEVDGTSVRIEEGAARMERGFGMSVASYDASVSLDSAGQARSVPALRQMAVPDLGRPPAVGRPITVDESDPWDRRFLGSAIDLGEELELLASGLFDNLPADRVRSADFYRFVLPGLEEEADFDDDLLEPDRASAEILLGAAVSDLGERGDFASRWEEVFAFRDAGAEWGLVALDQAVRSGPLVEVVESALGVGLQEADFALPPAPDAPTPSTTVPPPVTEAPEAPVEPTSPPSTPPSTSPPPTSPPPATPLPTPSPLAPPLLDPLIEPVAGATDLLGGVIDGLLGTLLGG